MDIGALTGAAQGVGSAVNSSATRLAGDFDTFLILLTTQLQQQDPLDPLNSNEFTQQLVQFTSVEQAIATNQNLEKVIALLSGKSSTNLVEFIGKGIVAIGDVAPLSAGEAVWRYTIDANANETKITIADATGKIVYKAAGATSAGEHELVWDGRDNLGNAMPDGLYRVSINATSADGSTIGTSTAIQGRVTSIELADGHQTLVIDGLQVELRNVTSVHEIAP